MKTKLKSVGEEIDNIDWEDLTEEDYTELPKSRLPILIYIDANKNHYYFVKSNIIADTKKSDDFLYQKGKQNPQIDDRLCTVCSKPLSVHSSFYNNHSYKPVD